MSTPSPEKISAAPNPGAELLALYGELAVTDAAISSLANPQLRFYNKFGVILDSVGFGRGAYPEDTNGRYASIGRQTAAAHVIAESEIQEIQGHYERRGQVIESLRVRLGMLGGRRVLATAIQAGDRPIIFDGRNHSDEHASAVGSIPNQIANPEEFTLKPQGLIKFGRYIVKVCDTKTGLPRVSLDII